MELYSQHLSGCSSVASEISLKLSSKIGEMSPKAEEFTKSGKAQKILSAIGIDSVSSSLMTLPITEMAETIHQACLKNELQFQCAYGFIQDKDKISAHIMTMIENDGNIKMMFESECKRPEFTPSTYACIGDNTEQWVKDCGVSIGAYNNTRTNINIRMGTTYADVMMMIEELMGKANTESELVKLMGESSDLMATTLQELSKLESFKCRSYYQMERCLLKSVNKVCGFDSVHALETILRVGYLRRERGDDLHMQFLESEIPPTKACAKTFNS
ncbi:hypothetical protein FO519_002934 [Halicephalobus sp. NKZ332]|nr:hypothetical protein FO519_002934 [Halicephalobus sp. NKZ332]